MNSGVGGGGLGIDLHSGFKYIEILTAFLWQYLTYIASPFG